MYYSAHRGPVFDIDGSFHHFARQCDPVHLKNGYWKFSTYDDDRRAYLHGLFNPEEVLIAQEAGDGDYEDIMLRWVPGELDATDTTLLGTAAAHLQTISDKMKLLGKTLSFRDGVPLYPISTDLRLSQSPILRRGKVGGVLLDDLLSPASPFTKLSPAKRPSSPSIPTENPSEWTTRSPQSASVPLLSLSVPQDQSRPAELPLVEVTTAVASPNKTPARASQFVTAKEPPRLHESLLCMRDREAIQSIEHDHRGDFPLGLPASNMENVRCGSPRDLLDSIEKQSSVDGNVDASHMHDSDDIVVGSTDRPVVLSLASLTPAHLFHAQLAALPCMDCESLEAHTCDCWINKATLSLTPTEDLTTSMLHRLADDVDEFDPGPWTTHLGPQQEVEEDVHTQLLGMADVIRNLDATANDLELQGLDDQCTILFWVFKSIGKVKVLSGQSEQNCVEMLDM